MRPNEVRPATARRGVTALALLPALALVACSQEGEPEPAGSGPTPSERPSVAVSAEPDGAGGLVARLPRLPIDGEPVAFTPDRPLGCVEVTLTGEPLPEGATVTIEAFDVPPGFQAAGVACEGLEACLGGPGLTGSGSCSLPLRWDGETVPPGAAELAVLAAGLACPSQTVCDEAATAVTTSGAGTVDLEVSGGR